MKQKPIELMRCYYGSSDGNTCGTCCNLRDLRYNSKRLRKCIAYAERDALKEGIEPEYRIKIPDSALQRFANEWDRKFSKELDTYGWDADPFVWVVEFERCDKPANWLD